MRAPLTALSLLVAAVAFAGTPVAPKDLAQRLGSKSAPLVIDVRTPEEYARGHVPGARNIPISELDVRQSEIPKDADVVVYCEHGPRATRAEALLEHSGHSRVAQLAGSMSGWREAQLPVEAVAPN